MVVGKFPSLDITPIHRDRQRKENIIILRHDR